MASRIPAIFDAQDPCSPLFIPNSQTALLLLDYQKISLAACTPDAVTKVIAAARSMQEWAFNNGILIVHCVVDIKSDIMRSMKAAGRLKVLQGKLQSIPALGEEHEGLAKISEDEETDARRAGFISALKGPRLQDILNAAGIKSLIMGGISTSGCLLSTCRAATDAEYIVTVVEDACADRETDLHNMIMQHVVSSTAHVAKSIDLIEVWKSKTLTENREKEKTHLESLEIN